MPRARRKAPPPAPKKNGWGGKRAGAGGRPKLRLARIESYVEVGAPPKDRAGRIEWAADMISVAMHEAATDKTLTDEPKRRSELARLARTLLQVEERSKVERALRRLESERRRRARPVDPQTEPVTPRQGGKGEP